MAKKSIVWTQTAFKQRRLPNALVTKVLDS